MSKIFKGGFFLEFCIGKELVVMALVIMLALGMPLFTIIAVFCTLFKGGESTPYSKRTAEFAILVKRDIN